MRFLRFIPALLLSAMPAAAHTLYLGNYADAIHAADFDGKVGLLGSDRAVAPLTRASFLDRSADGRFLYAVAEGKPGLIASFAIGAGGALTPLNTRSSEGVGPCDIALSPDGRLVAVANYGGGSVIIHRVATDGSLDDKISFFRFVDQKAQDLPLVSIQQSEFVDGVVLVVLFQNRKRNLARRISQNDRARVQASRRPRIADAVFTSLEFERHSVSHDGELPVVNREPGAS